MADFLFWLAVGCCVVAQAAILRATFRTHARRADVGAGIPRPRRFVEIVWAVVPAIALAIVLVVTWRAVHPPVGSPAPAAPLERTP